MKQGMFVGLMSLLAGAGLAHGKMQLRPPSDPANTQPATKAVPVEPVPTLPAPAAVSSPLPPAVPAIPSPVPPWVKDTFDAVLCGEHDCERHGEFRAGVEYVLWFFPDRREPRPFATTGLLGQSTLLGSSGDEHLERHLTSGGQLSLGYWMVDENPWVAGHEIRTLGVETRFLFVGQRSVNFRNGTAPAIVRPFFDLNDRSESAIIVAAPGFATGALTAHATMDVWGTEVNVWKNAHYSYPGTTFSVDLMAGFRFLDVDQDLEFGRRTVYNANLAAFPTFLSFAGNQIQEQESFRTRNHFYGAQVGVSGRFFLEGVTVEGAAKLAVGTTNEEVRVEGNQVRTLADGTRTVAQGALLALPSNIGTFRRDKFAQVPELSTNVIWPVMHHVTLTTGFSALLLSRLVRASEQIDRGIDITQIPNYPPATTAVPTGFQRPSVPFEQSSLWLLGIHFGVEITW